ncbi:MAG: enoyl-CoA hydratase/isomerase family protein [Bacteroidota bacterium]
MTDKTQQGEVRYSVEAGIGTITFFHPAHNSLPGKLLAELAKTIEQAGTDEAAKVLVLKSGGERTFCAGASFDELVSIRDEASGKEFFSGFANVINACRKAPKLIIGRVQGKVVGGGVGVAAATDYCLATRFASVKLSELAVGIGPFVVGPAVERKLGTSAMSQLAIDATNWRSAEWARERGLYAGVYDSAEELDAAVQALAETLAASHLAAMSEMKRIFWAGTDHWGELLAERAAVSGRLVLAEAAQSRIRGFLKK